MQPIINGMKSNEMPSNRSVAENRILDFFVQLYFQKVSRENRKTPAPANFVKRNDSSNGCQKG